MQTLCLLSHPESITVSFCFVFFLFPYAEKKLIPFQISLSTLPLTVLSLPSLPQS